MLEVKNLTKNFGTFKAVDNVSFSARGGEIFGLLGPNGAGKTTTIRVIATILEATGGRATVKGFDISQSPEDVRKHIGLLTADIGLYDRFSARENLKYYGELYGMKGEQLERRIDELVELLDMKRFADRRAGKFSTGMKQKVAIARSVIHNPDVIIFDEPTSGLDVLASQTVIRFMKQMKSEGKLVILSTHDMTHAQALCDRVAIIHRSKLITEDSVKNILAIQHTQTLEEAFIKIVGDNETHELSRQEESKAFGKREGKQSKVLTQKNWLIIRLVSLGILFAGFGFRLSSDGANVVMDTIGIILIVIGIAGAIAARFFAKRK